MLSVVILSVFMPSAAVPNCATITGQYLKNTKKFKFFQQKQTLQQRKHWSTKEEEPISQFL